VPACGQRPGRVRRTFRHACPGGVPVRGRADRELVGRRGSGLADVPGSLAAAADGHPGGGSLRPWLLGIAVNVTRNQARAARRHRAAMSRIAPPPDLPDFAEELTARLDDRDRLAALRAAVRGLPPSERDVLICVWSGLDSTEAAQALGVPEGTVRTRLSRARRRLRALAADAAPPAGPHQAGPHQAGPQQAGPRNDPGAQGAVQRPGPIRPANMETP